MSYYCKEDQNLFEKYYIDILKLFGSDNNIIIRAFNKRLKEVNTYSGEYYDGDVNNLTPGKTGYENYDINGRIYIKIKGTFNNNKRKNQIQHYFGHELCHAFAVSAQDAFSMRQKLGFNKNGIPVFKTTIFGNDEYLGISGSIYRKLKGTETENVIYGTGFCEVMTDLFAIAAKVASNFNEKINVDKVFKRPSKEWNIEEINTGYFNSFPLARLAIAAFSNCPNIQYQNIINSGGSIFSSMFTDKNIEVKINDFIYGIMCDPIYIAEEYDKISGKVGSYFQLCQVVDRIVDNFAYKRSVKIEDIDYVIQKLDLFTQLKCLIKVNNGVFTKQYADGIYEEFLRIKHDVKKEYSYLENQNENKEQSKIRAR